MKVIQEQRLCPGCKAVMRVYVFVDGQERLPVGCADCFHFATKLYLGEKRPFSVRRLLHQAHDLYAERSAS